MRSTTPTIGMVWFQVRSLARFELALTAAAMLLRVAVGIGTRILPYRCWRRRCGRRPETRHATVPPRGGDSSGPLSGERTT